jgi:type VI protein secretion system component Hcp
MKNRGLSATTSLLLTGSVIGCTGLGPQNDPGVPNEPTGTAEIAITSAPADGTCVAITAQGSRTVSKKFDVAPGGSTVMALHGLPLGDVTFIAQAFGGTCDKVTSDSVPNWVTDAPVSAKVLVRPPVLVTLNLARNGSAVVSVDFDDGPDGSVTGGSPAPASGTLAFMSVSNIIGESNTPGFVGWFDIQDLQLSVQNASSTTGGGAGSGKATWAASATLRAQKGSPELHLADAKGTVLPSVQFAFEKSGQSPFAFFRATLTNAVVSAVQTSGSAIDLPTETVTFTFSQIGLESDEQNVDGTPGPVTSRSWDLLANKGTSTQVSAINLDLRVGGGSSTDAITVASVEDASFTQPFAPSVLDDFMLTASGRRVAALDIDVSIPDAAGGFSEFGSYGFSNVTIHSVKLAALKATVGFSATGSTWTVGQDTVSFP